MITIALHWWYLPLGLFIVAVLLMWRAEHAGGGYFAGMGHVIAAIAFLGAALMSLITGLIK